MNNLREKFWDAFVSLGATKDNDGNLILKAPFKNDIIEQYKYIFEDTKMFVKVYQNDKWETIFVGVYEDLNFDENKLVGGFTETFYAKQYIERVSYNI